MKGQSSNAPSVSGANIESPSPKVPPLRIIIPASTASSSVNAIAAPSSNGNGNVSPSTTVVTSSTITVTKFPYVVSSSDESFPNESDAVTSGVGSSQRITRSSQRVAQQLKHNGGSNDTVHQSDESEESSHTAIANDSQHPRKRKIRTKDNDNDNDSSSSSSSVGTKEISPFAMPSSNCYQMFINIRKQIDKRRKEMFTVHPKAPPGFKDFLLNRSAYLIESKSDTHKDGNNSTIPVMVPPPSTLTPGSGMYALFSEHEKQRHKIKIQHLIEREKLILSTEQEVLRVHTRAARAMTNQTVPFSVCTILKDDEIYNSIEPEVESNSTSSRPHQDNAHKVDTKPCVQNLSGRTRYNGRLFLTWLQDLHDKWEKTKVSMILRHRKESESLYAMQKLEWEWKLKELGLSDVKLHVMENYVPSVRVEDFDLLPS